MSLFQNSVVTKYLQGQDKTKLFGSWIVFKNHFQNPTIQENICNSKEEQYQGEFLIDLFVNVLGYTKNPAPNFNLTTEYKNVKDSKKADGAILIKDKVRAVIELKGTNTTDLSKIEVQAFGYKNNQPDCVYVITANFEKLRFYIDNATEFLEFNLFHLTEKEFELLYLCLAHDNIANDVPKKLKEQSLSREKDITKSLYNDYSLFKRELHQDLVQRNTDFDALELFKKSQKLLDRFLFLFFAEDRQLLPPNSVRLILGDWRDLQERDEEIPLYNRFKKYFEYLNTGFKGKRYDVFAYNGGLFKPDAVLDAIKIDDELLFKHTLKLSEYDFVSEVDVNILGHIFENSLNELDEVKAQLEGGVIEKQNTKRKKDGVFYTPKYITKYIVDNTIGKLCTDKKTEIKIIEEDYHNDKKRTKATKQPLLEKLTNYRDWLLQITICDPACGSGAFLNQALDFLITEHKYIDELQAKLFGDAMVLSDVEKSILENNLYGVDLNEESVEIAKLSLWLRTAQPNRKLNNLNDNIKCGNSLIDDVAIAGEKAFNWQTAFPKIFKEKNKKAFHITTAIHDSRTSQRMIDYKVRAKRAMGTMPEPQINYLTDNDEMVIATTLSILVKEQLLNVLAFNVCKDHIHLVLVCEEEEVNEIVRKIKGRTAREVNKANGINPIVNKEYNNNIGSSNKGLKPLVDSASGENIAIAIGENNDISIGENIAIGIGEYNDNNGLKPIVGSTSVASVDSTRGASVGSTSVASVDSTIGENSDISIGENIDIGIGENSDISIGENIAIGIGENSDISIGENIAVGIGENIDNNGLKPIVNSTSLASVDSTIGENSDISIGENIAIGIGENNDNNGLKPIVDSTRGENIAIGRGENIKSTREKSIPLWTQKFHCKEIIDENQLSNTIHYVKTNRVKHNLPDNSNKRFKALIESITCDYEYAFRAEYKGGFDVVIGNPPYVRSRGLFEEKEKEYYINNYSTSSYQLDLYKLFIEKSCKIINSNGCMSFITPSVFLINEYDKPLRKFLLNDYNLNLIANTDENIFDDASVKTVVFVIDKKFSISSKINFFKIVKSQFIFEKQVLQELFVKQDYLINEKIDSDSLQIVNKLKKISFLDDFYEVKNGIKVRKELLFDKQDDANFKPFILGKNISPYYNSYDNIFIDYRIENEKLYSNQAFRNKEIFQQEKLIVRQILGKKIATTYDIADFFTDQTTYVINVKNPIYTLKYLICILNSKLMFYYFTNTSSDNKVVFPKVKKSQLLELPIVKSQNQNPFIEKADLMLSLNKDLQEQSQKFQRTIQRKFELDELPKKLQDWYLLSYGDFVKELAKKKIKLSLAQESDWEEYFITEATKLKAIKSEIEATDKIIDAMVYELYGLTKEEIAIVESAK